MSRVPIHLDPWPTDAPTRQFAVMSEEWSSAPENPAQLATLFLSEDHKICTFVPGPLWLELKLFPVAEQSFTHDELDALCNSPESYSPRSIYSHRTLQAMRRVLAARSEE